LDVPVVHDDQHGTAVVVLGALINALRVTGKTMEDLRIVMSGAGAAGTAIVRLLQAAGAARAASPSMTATACCDLTGMTSTGKRSGWPNTPSQARRAPA
jgi:malic enzyme